ncbi:MAG: glutamyl-tRNA reductase [Pseudomonadota bacterium]
MQILVVGLSHKSASVEIRERLAFSKDELFSTLPALVKFSGIQEAILISTCNRVEFFLNVENVSDTVGCLKEFLAEVKNIPQQSFESLLYLYEDDHAVRHIFRVASSLDSMVMGEAQILGQVKEAHRQSISLNTSGIILNRLFEKAFSVAKRVRTETGVASHAVSISYAAVELAKKIFDDLSGRAAMLIGAGEMAVLALQHLSANGATRIFVANRTFERAVEVAGQFQGTAVRFEEIPDILLDVDIVISSTGASHHILTYDDIRPLMRRRRSRSLFFIDIAVPRNIDPNINRIDNVYVYDIDELNGIVNRNVEERKHEAIKAERIVDEGVIQFRKWLNSLESTPTIVALRDKVEEIRRAELHKALSGLKGISEGDRDVVERLTLSICNKLLHSPTVFLKRLEGDKKRGLYIDTVRRLFKLSEEGDRK